MQHPRPRWRRLPASLAAAGLGLGFAGPSQGAGVDEAALTGALVDRLTPLLAGMNDESPRYVEVRDGWIYKRSVQLFVALNPELFPGREHREPSPLREPVEAIVDARDQLARAGIELLVVPIPTRLDVYPDAVVDVVLGEDFRGYAPGMAKLLARLRAHDVDALDLLPEFTARRGTLDGPEDELVFLRANSHWTPKGAVLAAEALAGSIRERAWFDASGSDSEATHLERSRAAWTPDDGELAEGAAPPVLEFERVVDAEGRPAARSDRSSPVVLWGDSFTTIFEPRGADLPRRLHHALGAAVDVVASPGGGPHASRAAFARRHAPLAGKHLVIWAFSANTLIGPNWGEVRLERPPPRSRAR